MSGSSAAAQARCGAEHVRVGRVEHRRLDRRAEQRLRVVHQVGVQRVVAGHQHRERLLAGPPGAARLLPERGPGAREARDQHRVQPGQVDAQLQRVGRGEAEQVAAEQRLLQRAPLLPQVAAAVGGHPVPQLRGDLGEQRARADRGHDSAPRRERTNASVRAPSTTRSASRSRGLGAARTGGPGAPFSPTELGQQRRLPQREGPACRAARRPR